MMTSKTIGNQMDIKPSRATTNEGNKDYDDQMEIIIYEQKKPCKNIRHLTKLQELLGKYPKVYDKTIHTKKEWSVNGKIILHQWFTSP